MADEPNLLPCPFCDSSPDLLLDADDCPYVACPSCHISLPAYRPGFERMAIAAWNRRAAPAAQLDREWVQKTWFECNQHLYAFAQAIASRRTEPAAAQLDAELPPLPKETAWMVPVDGVFEYYATERAAKSARAAYEKVMGADAEHVDPEPLYTAEKVRNFVAPYAERIRMLTEGLATAAQEGRKYQRKVDEKIIAQRDERIRLLEKTVEIQQKALESREKVDALKQKYAHPAQSIDTPEFRELIEAHDAAADFKQMDAAYSAIVAYIDGRTAGTAPIDPVEGDLLPPIGARVLIHLGRQDAWVEHTVTGYYVWGALAHQVREGEKHAHRVFVRVKDANGYDNARLLAEVRIAAAPSPGKDDAKP